MRSQSFDEEATNRRQLPNVPKKPVRQSTLSRDNREPTPDYDSGGDKESKSPLATSPMKKSGPPDSLASSDKNLDQQMQSSVGSSSENNLVINKNVENLNQTRGESCVFEKMPVSNMYHGKGKGDIDWSAAEVFTRSWVNLLS